MRTLVVSSVLPVVYDSLRKERHRMCETRGRRPGHACPSDVCDTGSIFCHVTPITRRTEIPEFQSYYIVSGTNVAQPNKCKCSRYWRPCSAKAAGRCRQQWARGVQRTVSGVLINATACDARWKLYVVVSGRKYAVAGYASRVFSWPRREPSRWVHWRVKDNVLWRNGTHSWGNQQSMETTFCYM